MKTSKLNVLLLATILFLLSTLVRDSRAQGVTETEVKIGMVNALSGNAAALGTGMSAGARACFERINAGGGIHGRKITLISRDDGYEPESCVQQTRELLEKESVFSLLGYVGTPTATAVMPILHQNPDLVFLAPFTGAEFLRNPVKKNVFNIRASYFDETEDLVQHLTSDVGIREIGIFVQEDAFGAAGEAGVQKALRKRGLTLAGKGTYKRNTADVDAGVAALKQTQPRAVVMVGTYKACAAFVKAARSAGLNSVFCSISFVGTASLIQELGPVGDGVVVSQILPSPQETSIPLIKDYQTAMQAAGIGQLDYTSLEGFVAASVCAEALKKCGRDLTRATYLQSLESLKSDLGGVAVEFSPTSHQALNKVYLTVIQGGRAVPVTDLKDVKLAAK